MKQLITDLFTRAVLVLFMIVPPSAGHSRPVIASGYTLIHTPSVISSIGFPEDLQQNNDSATAKQETIKVAVSAIQKVYFRPTTQRLLNFSYNNHFIPATGNDSPYQFSLSRELPIIGTSTGLLAGALLIHKQKPTLSAYQLDELDHKEVWAFDRGATYHYSPAIDRFSDVFLYTSVAMPGLYLIDKKTKADFNKIMLLQAETGLAVLAITAFTKSVTHRSRPYAYHPLPSVDEKVSLKTTASFFSGHTSVSAAMSYFTATTFAAYHPDSKLKPFVWAYAATWPAVTGYLRYRAGYHYPTDILVGYVVGAATGIIVPKIHQAVSKKSSKRRSEF
jgi:membrane-associated phospholipid phosphatase